jgi:hypothetical protein
LVVAWPDQAFEAPTWTVISRMRSKG